MRWITLRQVLAIHQDVIVATGGSPGILNLEHLESTLSRPFGAFADHEIFPDLFSKVSALIHGIISTHPFVDGNKRTALVAADVCLKLNGHRLLQSGDVEQFFWSIARGEQTVETIAEWLKSHTEGHEDS